MHSAGTQSEFFAEDTGRMLGRTYLSGFRAYPLAIESVEFPAALSSNRNKIKSSLTSNARGLNSFLAPAFYVQELKLFRWMSLSMFFSIALSRLAY